MGMLRVAVSVLALGCLALALATSSLADPLAEVIFGDGSYGSCRTEAWEVTQLALAGSAVASSALGRRGTLIALGLIAVWFLAGVAGDCGVGGDDAPV